VEKNQDIISKLTEEIVQLRDLFVRRLSDDKAKTKIYEALVEQNNLLNKQIEGKMLESLFLELLLVCDRIDSQTNKTDFLDSITEEIMEIFARRGICSIEVESGPYIEFNPEYQKAIDTIPACEEYPEGSIVSVKRKGYCIKNRVLRPTEVVVAVKSE